MSEEEKNQSSTQQVPLVPLAPGNYDRAWNDPPLFSYSSGASNTFGGAKLKKRVGFPSGVVTQTNTGSDPTAPPKLYDAGTKPPPMTSALPPPPLPTITGVPAKIVGTDIPPPANDQPGQVAVDTTCLSNRLRELTREYCGQKTPDILKRLDIMETALASPTINSRIPNLLLQFTDNLEKKNVDVAERILTTLGADHSGDCGQWIIAVRHLLNSAKSQIGPQVSKDGSEVASPYFIPASS